MCYSISVALCGVDFSDLYYMYTVFCVLSLHVHIDWFTSLVLLLPASMYNFAGQFVQIHQMVGNNMVAYENEWVPPLS